ncbi:LRR domain containing protein, partial [Trema orientale]
WGRGLGEIAVNGLVLVAMTHLDLFKAGFEGMIPHQLGNLTNLVYFDLSYNFKLYAENLQWLSRLSMLQYLNMSRTNLSESSDWLEVTNALPSLVELRFSDCSLRYNVPTLHHVNFSSIANLDLSFNRFTVIPTWIFKLRNLASLDVSGNYISGPIPNAIQNLTSLKLLDLSWLSLNSSIPSWLYRFSSLEVLNFQHNSLRGPISSDIKNLTSITSLDLSANDFEGKLPISMGELCKLRRLDLSWNKWNQEISLVLDIFTGCVSDGLEHLALGLAQFSGHLTDQIGQFKILKYLSLGSNSISGPVPASLSKLSSLEHLDISSNNLKGIVSEAHFTNMTSLRAFFASKNPLTFHASPDWIPPFQLERLQLSSLQLGPQFPLWLHTQTNLIYLDISNTSLSCVLPSWFGNFSSHLSVLILSNNEMHGRLPDLSKAGDSSKDDISDYDLSFNQFEGSLPGVSSKMISLDLRNNRLSGSLSSLLCNNKSEPMSLQLLDLGNNQLEGKIPKYCWSRWKNLKVISLINNQFMGTIPSSMSSLIALNSLHLRNNSFSGNLPLVLQNFAHLFTLDLGGNKFRGNIPSWIGTELLGLRILNIRANKIYGHIPEELCGLSSLQILDLSSNNLSGPIPKCFNNFRAMVSRNPLSHYYLINSSLIRITEDAVLAVKGKMYQYDVILPLVTSIDLSSNILSGRIPAEITSLSGLLFLNLSNNLLTGVIPTKIGNMSSLESIDFSMNQLSGEIPPSMSSLAFLSYLNLSYNNLRGTIPTGTQLQSFTASSYVGNHLCGPPVTKSCDASGVSPGVENVNGKKHGLELDWFYVSMALGYVVGLWGVIGSLLLNRSWRFFYFRFLENMWYKLYDCVCKYCD